MIIHDLVSPNPEDRDHGRDIALSQAHHELIERELVLVRDVLVHHRRDLCLLPLKQQSVGDADLVAFQDATNHSVQHVVLNRQLDSSGHVIF